MSDQKGQKKRALITGITGQDGAYLTKFLLDKNYEVHGIKRRASLFNTQRIDRIYQDPHEQGRSLVLHYGDLTDGMALMKVVESVRPDEIYNLGAMSHVAVSFENPLYTADVNAMGTLRLLEAVRLLGLKTRFYQASTSELYGKVHETPQKESTPFHPRSPYGVSKLFAYWSVVNYREAYDMFAVNGVLFNHESPMRGETFVSRKITRALARIKLGLETCLYLGNMDARRDWGHARDYVEMQWMMLQQDQPRDFVIATGLQESVREFVRKAATHLDMDIEWRGSGISETGFDRKSGKTIVSVDPRYFRPAEVETLLGDATLARETLGWKPRTTLNQLIEEMVWSDLEIAKQEAILRDHGHAKGRFEALM